MKKAFKKVGKVIGYIVLVILILFILISIALQHPKVQNWVAQEVTKQLEQKLDTEFSVDRIYLRFFSSAVIEGLYIEDQQQDTLAHVGEFSMSLGVFSLFQQKIHIQSVNLSDATVHLHNSEQDSTFNFQFIIDAFAPTQVDTTTGTPWEFSINKVVIQSTYFTYHDPVAGIDLNTRIGDFSSKIKELGLDSSKLDLRWVDLSNSFVRFTKERDSLAPTVSAPADSSLSPLVFPYTGWELSAGNITLDNNTIIYDDNNYQSVPEQVDFFHLNIQNTRLDIDDFEWTKEHLKANLEEFALNEKSGFIINHLASDIQLNDQEISLENLRFITPSSDLEADARLSFTAFNDLTNFLETVDMNVEVSPSKVSAGDIQYLSGALTAIPYLDTKNIANLNLKGKVNGKVNNLDFSELELWMKNAFRLQANGNITGLPDPTAITFNVTLDELSTSYQSLLNVTKGLELPPGLKNFGQFQVSGGLNGTLDNIKGDRILITTQASTKFSGDLRIKNITDIDQAQFDLQIKELTTKGEDLAGFLGDTIPAQLDSLGVITYQGGFKGTLKKFNLNGQLNTALGQVNQNLDLSFNEDYSNASYFGELKTKKFELGRLLGTPEQFGTLDIEAELDGKGLSVDSLSSEVNALVQRLEFNDYVYKDLQINGRFDRMEFDGSTSIKDENLAFDFNGRVNLNDSLPDFQFSAVLDTADLQALHFYPDPLRTSMQMNINLTGNSIDNLVGKGSITQIRIANDTARFVLDSMIIEANALDNDRRLVSLHSELLNAKIEGQYNLAELPKLMVNFINDFFPIDQMMNPVDQPEQLTQEPQEQELVRDQDFVVEIGISRPVRLTKLFLPALSRLDTAYLTAEFVSREKRLDLQGVIPRMTYNELLFDSIKIVSTGDTEKLTNRVSFQSIRNDLGDVIIPFSEAKVNMLNDSLYFNLASLEDDGRQNFDLAGAVVPSQNDYLAHFNGALIVNDTAWQIPDQNRILFGSRKLNIQDLKFEKGPQALYIQSEDTAEDRDLSPIQIGFNKFDLGEISRLAKLEEELIEGKLNGSVRITNLQNTINYNVDLEARSLVVNGAPVGTLTVEASPTSDQKHLNLFTRLKGEQNSLLVKGKYGLEDQSLDIDVEMDRLQMSLLDALLPGMVKESSGTLEMSMDISGTTTQPIVDGNLQLNDVSTFIEYLQGQYSFGDHQINIDKEVINFGTIQMQDSAKRKATLSGKVYHNYLNEFRLDLDFQTDEFQFLNTKAGDNDLFFGQVLLDTRMKITGTATVPVVNINARTLPGTRLVTQPLTTQQSIVEEDFIIYADPAVYVQDTTGIRKIGYQRNTAGIDLSLNLDLTPDAELQVIIDPATGDKLICRGRANITVDMEPSGDIRTTGIYTITSGSYFLNYENIVKRSFTIREGSQINLVGDPLDSRFDITAVYTAKTSLYPLVANQTNAQIDTLEAQKRSNVNVLLNLEGDLSGPEISFDIEVPSVEAGQITSAVNRKLSQLREQENELNKQVFGLLLFNSFISEQSGSSSLASTGQNIALSSVSSLITEQLNNLAQKYVKGVNISFGLESYKAQFSENNATVTELDVQLSKNLFNDRLTVRVGGNVDLSSESATPEETGLTAVAGDFVLEYKLTPNGNYRLRVFSKSDYDAIDQSNIYKTGVGIMYRKSFGGPNSKKKKEQKDGSQ